MRYTIIFASIVLLSGCQSEFDKCMETEAPRAESILALSDMSSAITDFKSESNFMLMFMQAEASTQLELASTEPAGRPVQPQYPPYTCSLDEMSRAVWQACYDAHEERVKVYEEQKPAADLALQEWNERPEVVAWTETFEAVELAAIRAAGLEVESFEELERLVNSKEAGLETVEAALKERGAESDCWGNGDDDCYDPISAELEGKFGIDWRDDDYPSKRYETAKLAIAEILVTMTNKYSVATNKAQELAVLTCNQNGFYE